MTPDQHHPDAIPHPQAPTTPSHEEMQRLAGLALKQARRVTEKIPLLGAASWLMMQQGGLRHTLLSELDWRVMPPLVLDQAKVYLRDGAPVAYVSWARLSESVAQRYAQTPHHLMPADWASGEQTWLVDLVAPFGGSQDVMKDVLCTVLRGSEVRQLMPDGSGGVRVHVWPAQ